MSAGIHPENAMSCRGIRLVFAKGSGVVKLPGGIPDDHVGPVLADLAACAPGADGFHKVPVKEIPTPALGAPLKHFLAEGKLPPSTRADASLLLAPSYKAAERLDVMGLVRAVERAAMAAVASGDVSLEDLAAAFAGCPRVAALCDNYLTLPGIRAPPPFNIMRRLPALLAEHGVLLLLCTHDLHPSRKTVLDSVKVVADTQRCRELADRHTICHDVIELLERYAEWGTLSRRQGPLTILSIPSEIEEGDIIYPDMPDSWLPSGDRHPFSVSQFSGDFELLDAEIHQRYHNDTRVTLAVDSTGQKLYSNNHAADQAYAKGIHRVFGGNLSIW